MRYVLITPVRNEERFIENTLRSMAAQTLRPERWVIVDDGSIDGTLRLIQQYSANRPWIEVVQRQQRLDRSFSGKVDAFNAGWDRVRSLSFDVIGNLDGDLSFDADYLEFLMSKFAQDPRLGVAGTPFTEDGGYDTALHSFEGENYVAGGCQLFRYQCFQEIGGYVANKAGGDRLDCSHVGANERLEGAILPGKAFSSSSQLGNGRERLRRSDVSIRRTRVLSGWFSDLARLSMFVSDDSKTIRYRGRLADGWLSLCGTRRTKRPVSREMIRFHRKEQMHKLTAICKAVLRRQKVDSFRVVPADNRSSL